MENCGYIPHKREIMKTCAEDELICKTSSTCT